MLVFTRRGRRSYHGDIDRKRLFHQAGHDDKGVGGRSVRRSLKRRYDSVRGRGRQGRSSCGYAGLHLRVKLLGGGTAPAKCKGKLFYRWNPNVTLMRTTVEENRRLGEIFAEKLNAGIGPVAVTIPLGRFSKVDYPGQPFWCPEAHQAFADAPRKYLRPDSQSTSARTR
jgi:uncharacterized protein (UPF0261 family)